jgi:hypothetical protein
MTIYDDINSLLQWKLYGDLTSAMLILASMASWLPPVASLLSILWVAIRIYETDTIQNLLYRNRKDKE